MRNGKIIDKYGNQAWYANNKLHREDGPAVIYGDGTKDLYLIEKIARMPSKSKYKKLCKRNFSKKTYKEAAFERGMGEKDCGAVKIFKYFFKKVLAIFHGSAILYRPMALTLLQTL